MQTARSILLSLCFLTSACATTPPIATTDVVFVADSENMATHGVVTTGDVFIRAIQYPTGYATVANRIELDTFAANGAVEPQDLLFKTNVESIRRTYCSKEKKAVTKIFRGKYSTLCFIDEDGDGSFEKIGLLNFESDLAFGSGTIRQRKDISPIKYLKFDKSPSDGQSIGFKFQGSGISFAAFTGAREYYFTTVTKARGKWRPIGNTKTIKLKVDKPVKIKFLNGEFLLQRLQDDRLAFKEIVPISVSFTSYRTGRIPGSLSR